ncbi:MAG: ImmA/IrrE family metallo-endopeptidase [Magnetococcus sp. YQC-9]
MSERRSPEEWALHINLILDTAFGRERHPVSVVEVARMFSAIKYPSEPIMVVEGGELPGFQGALIRHPNRGWGIVYNRNVLSKRRIRFTLAHEFGHYLMHRSFRPTGFQCVAEEIPNPEQPFDRLEREADTFASHFLIPPHDLVEQIPPTEWTDLNMLGCCADRYGVSLLALIRQWLRLTQQRAALVVSREGCILWSEASETAKKCGACFRESWKEPVEIPAQSLAAQRHATNHPKDGILVSKGAWFQEHDVVEMAVYADQYDFIISLLMLDFDQQATTPDTRSSFDC